MNRSRVASIAVLAAVAAAMTAAAAKAKQAASSSPITSRFGRTARIWKLSARNSARFAIFKVRGAASPAARRAQLDE